MMRYANSFSAARVLSHLNDGGLLQSAVGKRLVLSAGVAPFAERMRHFKARRVFSPRAILTKSLDAAHQPVPKL